MPQMFPIHVLILFCFVSFIIFMIIIRNFWNMYFYTIKCGVENTVYNIKNIPSNW